jgi:hypothetical protein
LKGDFGMNENAGNRVLRELELDEQLASEAQEAVRGFVKALPHEELSLAWRSGLNERLLAASAKQRRQRLFGWVWKPAFGLSVAGALAILTLMRPSAPTPVIRGSGDVNGVIEASIVSTHRDSNAYSDVVGVGLLPVEVASGRTTSSPTRVDWDEVDIDTL